MVIVVWEWCSFFSSFLLIDRRRHHVPGTLRWPGSCPGAPAWPLIQGHFEGYSSLLPVRLTK